MTIFHLLLIFQLIQADLTDKNGPHLEENPNALYSYCYYNSECSTRCCISRSCVSSYNCGTSCYWNSDCRSGYCKNGYCTVDYYRCYDNGDCVTGCCFDGICVDDSECQIIWPYILGGLLGSIVALILFISIICSCRGYTGCILCRLFTACRCGGPCLFCLC